MNVCEVIERDYGLKVAPETLLEHVGVDSLEYIELLLTLGVDPAKNFITVGDIQKAVDGD